MISYRPLRSWIARALLFTIIGSITCVEGVAAEIDRSTRNGLFYLSSTPGALRARFASERQLIYSDYVAGGLSKRTLEVIGGVLFKGTYVPGTWQPTSRSGTVTSPDFDSAEYRASATDGQRLILHSAGSDYTVPMADWLVLPLLNYADSGSNAVVTLFGAYDQTDTERLELLSGAADVCKCRRPYLVAIHPAFQDTRAGMLILYSDIIPIDERFRTPPTLNGDPLVPGYPPFDNDASNSAYEELQYIIGSADSAFVSYIMSDPSTTYRIDITKPNTRFSGLPHYTFWHHGDDGSSIIYNDDVNRSISERQSILRKINQPVYSTIYRVARWSAILRTIKAGHPDAWRSLMASIANVKIARDVDTPIIYGQDARP
jgi:hypothetical protein